MSTVMEDEHTNLVERTNLVVNAAVEGELLQGGHWLILVHSAEAQYQAKFAGRFGLT